jgi:ribosomal-protein-alanine N-acetyltransferase
MRWQDLPEVHRIEGSAFPNDPWSLPVWWAELAARPRRDYVVLRDDEAGRGGGTAGEGAVEGGGLIGYGGLDLAGETADVMTIAVAPAERGRGHGVVLLEELLRRAERSGASTVMLEVRADNDTATGLYERYGFQEVHRRRGYYQPGSVDAVIMQRKVGAGD